MHDTMATVVNRNSIMNKRGEHGGIVFEHRSANREVLGSRFPHRWYHFVSFSKTHWPTEYWLIPMKLWLRPDMTEKLLTWMLNVNTDKLSKENHFSICHLTKLQAHMEFRPRSISLRGNL